VAVEQSKAIALVEPTEAPDATATPRDGYAYQEDLLSPSEVAYWSEHIEREVTLYGQYGTVRTNDGDFKVDESYRRAKILFLNPWLNTGNVDELMTRRLLYSLLGFAMVAAGTTLKGYGYNLYYSLEKKIQLALYREGDMYNTHHDGGTGKDFTDKRKLSIGVCVEKALEGGEFYMQEAGWGKAMMDKINTPGVGLAFPSTALHGVKPVVRGSRKSITLWVFGS